jgi:hypothetical protein
LAWLLAGYGTQALRNTSIYCTDPGEDTSHLDCVEFVSDQVQYQY